MSHLKIFIHFDTVVDDEVFRQPPLNKPSNKTDVVQVVVSPEVFN